MSRARLTSAKSTGRFTADERGSMAVELVVLTPVLMLFALVALAFGRYEIAREQVVGAATASAQAAAVAISPGTASGAARSAAGPVIAVAGRTCTRSTVATDVSQFHGDGVVRVTVSCRVTLADLAVPGLPGSVTIRRTSVAPIDPYRAVG